MGEQVRDAASIVQTMIEQIDRPEQRYNCSCQVGGVDALSIDTDWLLANLRDLRDALAAHQPARVVPSAEEVAELRRRLATAEAVVRDLQREPTVAQVREQVAREIEAEIGPDPRVSGSIGLIRAARIARTETKGGE